MLSSFYIIVFFLDNMNIVPKIIIVAIVAVIGVGAISFAILESSTSSLDDILKNPSKSERAMQITDYVIAQYDADGQESFDRLLLQDKGEYLYGFVIDGRGIIIGHPNAEHLGEVSVVVTNGILSEDDIVELLESDGSSKWIEYQWENQLTGKVDEKTSFVKSHSGLLFGSGYYN